MKPRDFSRFMQPGNGNRLIVPPRLQPRVALGYPAGGSVTMAFHESVLRLQLYELAKPQPLLWHRLPQQGLYVGLNRNRIAQKFWKETAADWLLQIDTDVDFQPTIVETLVELAGRDKKVIAASVPLGVPYPSCGWEKTSDPGIFRCMRSEEILAEGTKADAAATAIFMVHRDVLDAIADAMGQCWFLSKLVPRLEIPTSAAAWGEAGPARDREFVEIQEDLAFCLRAGEVGFDVWVAKVPGLKHYKTLPMSHDYETEDEAVKATQASAVVVPWSGGNGNGNGGGAA